MRRNPNSYFTMIKEKPQKRSIKIGDVVISLQKGKSFGKECKVIGYQTDRGYVVGYLNSFAPYPKFIYEFVAFKNLVKKVRYQSKTKRS